MPKRTDQDYIDAAAKSISIAEMCRHLGLIPAGGNYHTLKEKIHELGIDTSHFLGNAHNLGKRFVFRPKSKDQLKKRLIEDRGHRCESCSNSEWLNSPITLELEHVDGDVQNNDFVNLKLLCPNCHSQTKTWRRSKKSLEGKISTLQVCPKCGGWKQHRSAQCRKCYLTNRSSKR
jgi:ribosomal protein L40E